MKLLLWWPPSQSTNHRMCQKMQQQERLGHLWACSSQVKTLWLFFKDKASGTVTFTASLQAVRESSAKSIKSSSSFWSCNQWNTEVTDCEPDWSTCCNTGPVSSEHVKVTFDQSCDSSTVQTSPVSTLWSRRVREFRVSRRLKEVWTWKGSPSPTCIGKAVDQAGKSNLTRWKVGRKLGHKYTSYHNVPRHVHHFKKTDCFACCCFSAFPTTSHKLVIIIFILSLCISKKAMAPSQLHKPKKNKVRRQQGSDVLPMFLWFWFVSSKTNSKMQFVPPHFGMAASPNKPPILLRVETLTDAAHKLQDEMHTATRRSFLSQ